MYYINILRLYSTLLKQDCEMSFSYIDIVLVKPSEY